MQFLKNSFWWILYQLNVIWVYSLSSELSWWSGRWNLCRFLLALSVFLYIYIYNVVVVGDRNQGWPEGSLFNSCRRGLHFTLDTYLVILSVKQVGIKYHFKVFGMTRPVVCHIYQWEFRHLPMRCSNIYIRVCVCVCVAEADIFNTNKFY